MGKQIVHVGGVGQGKVVKMVNQVMAAAHLLMLGEAFALGVRCGADPETLYEVIKTLVRLLEDDGSAAAGLSPGGHGSSRAFGWI